MTAMEMRRPAKGCLRQWGATLGLMLGMGLWLAGCGSTGPAGPAGPTGATGATGASGAPGAASAASVTSATAITATITSASIPTSSPAQPVIKFKLVDQNGQPLSGLTAAEVSFAVAKLVPAGTQLAALVSGTTAPAPLQSDQWQSYLYSLASPASPAASGYPVTGTSQAPQAGTEAGSKGTLVDNGDGTYQYTFNTDLAKVTNVSYDPALTHRVALEIRGVTNATSSATVYASSPVYTFQPSSGATTGIHQYDIVDDSTCNGCHQSLNEHGGARVGVKYCVVCHNPSTTDPSTGNSLDMKVLIHKVHTGSGLPSVSGTSLAGAQVTRNNGGYYIYGHGGAVNDFSSVIFPQADAAQSDMYVLPGNTPDYRSAVTGPGTRFCAVCHVTSDTATPQAGNFSTTPSIAACGSCHDNVNFTTGAGHSAANLVADNTQCVTCHGPGSSINNGLLTVMAAHTTGVDTAVKKFQYQIVGVTNTAPGQFPKVTLKVVDPTNSNAAYDLTDATGPFHQAASASAEASSLTLDLAWNTAGIGNVGSGSATAGSGTPNQTISLNFVKGTAAGGSASRNGDGSFTMISTTAIPSTATGSLLASVEGRAVVSLDNLSGSGTTPTNLGVQGVSQAFAITDTTPVQRAAIVDINKCDICHGGSGAQAGNGGIVVHGANRTNDINLCASCHNANATDIGMFTSTSSASACYSGLATTNDNPIDLKVLIHRIHASGDTYAYGTGGVTICAYGGNPTTFKVNYPGGNQATPAPSLANCESCHIAGTEYPVDPNSVPATTIHAGADRTTLTDDVAVTPNSAVCSGCHTDTSAMNHMTQNGGNFSATKTATGALTTPSTETCPICHGAGGTADVKVMHHIASFPGNQ